MFVSKLEAYLEKNTLFLESRLWNLFFNSQKYLITTLEHFPMKHLKNFLHQNNKIQKNTTIHCS